MNNIFIYTIWIWPLIWENSQARVPNFQFIWLPNVARYFDILLIVNHIIDFEELQGTSYYAADFNQDQTIDIVDILAVINIILSF